MKYGLKNGQWKRFLPGKDGIWNGALDRPQSSPQDRREITHYRSAQEVKSKK